MWKHSWGNEKTDVSWMVRVDHVDHVQQSPYMPRNACMRSLEMSEWEAIRTKYSKTNVSVSLVCIMSWSVTIFACFNPFSNDTAKPIKRNQREKRVAETGVLKKRAGFHLRSAPTHCTTPSQTVVLCLYWLRVPCWHVAPRTGTQAPHQLRR